MLRQYAKKYKIKSAELGVTRQMLIKYLPARRII
jgi:hypothetical protein